MRTLTAMKLLNKYKVTLEGSGFIVHIDGNKQKCGFFTTRFIEASTADLAIRQATELVVIEIDKSMPGARLESSLITNEEATELISFGAYAIPGEGFSWFIED